MFATITNKLAGRAALLGGAAFAAGGVTEIVHSQRSSGDRVVGVSGHLVVAFFAIGLIAIAPSFVALARSARQGVAQKAALAAAAGTVVLGLTAFTSFVSGRDLAIFIVMAPLTNAAWLLGSLILGVSLWRTGTVSRVVAVGLPVAWVFAIPLATVGGGIVAGAYYLWLGYLLADDVVAESSQPARV
jgi:hypothetical protein